MSMLSDRRLEIAATLVCGFVLLASVARAQAPPPAAGGGAPGAAGGATAPAGVENGGPAGEAAAPPRPDREQPSTFLKGRFLAGANWGSVATVDNDLGTQYKVSPFFRWNSRRAGWGPSFGLSWFEADLRAPVDGRATSVGTVRMRPVMAGVGYTIARGRLRSTYGVVTGYAFNDAKLDVPLPAGVSASIDIDDAWVLQPKADFTFALTRRLALVGTAGYVISNPSVSVTVVRDGVITYRSSDHVRTDSVVLRVGAAIGVF